MIRNSMRSSRLLSWRYLRWAIAIPTLPVVWWACTSHPLTQPTPAPELQTDIYISVSNQRVLDLVFMVDNSPSMAPKVTKMNAQFTKLISALKDPNDGTLPDLRVALIDSDLGTGCQYGSGSCGPKDPATNSGCYGDQGKFQMLATSPASANTCTFDSGALFLEVKTNKPVNFPANADINTVFACLASNLGTLGCGEEHQLQAFEFALAAKGVDTEAQQAAFLRPNAYLGLVFLSDEDDCSAAMNDKMFGEKDELKGESASLRCATRGHMCAGRNLAIQNDTSLPGYPTTNAYTHAFNDCQARADTCPNVTDGYQDGTDTSGWTDCAALKNIEHLAGEIRGLKTDPENQILVAGIFGWPTSDAEMAKAEYKIAKIPNPNVADVQHPTVFDYWPVCYDPDHLPAAATTDSATGFDSTAAGWGATGGLREAAFIDQFGDNGLKFSICERDFTKAMDGIGQAIAKKLQNLCIDYKLIDTDTNTAGVQADCRVVWRTPKPADPAHPNVLQYDESPESMPQCPPNSSQGNVAKDCWQLTSDKTKCPVNGQLIQVFRTADEIAKTPQLTAGTKVGMQCRTCTDKIPGTDPVPGCVYTL